MVTLDECPMLKTLAGQAMKAFRKAAVERT
jgi:hypothetical protein